MTNIYLSPEWFDPFSIIFEAFFFIVTLLLAIIAFRVRKSTGERSAGLFAWSFLMIAISYFCQSLFNFLVLSNLKQSICGSNLYSLAIFDAIGTYLQILFMMVGLSGLLYLTLHTQKKRVLMLLILVSLSFMYLSNNLIRAYFFLSLLYLVFISWHFYEHYLARKDTKTLVVATAFTLLILSRLVLSFVWRQDNDAAFVLAYFLELAAYLAILANFYLVFKR